MLNLFLLHGQDARVRQNKLGLRAKDDPEYETQQPADIDSLLEFSNILREIAGVDTKIKTEASLRDELLHEFLSDFTYLNNAKAKKEVSDLISKTLVSCDSDNNVVKFPANNAILLIFRFLDALTMAINGLRDAQADKKVLFTESKRASKSGLVMLHKNILATLNMAFDQYGLAVDQFLVRFDNHKLWQNSLSQKQLIIAAIQGAVV